MRILGFGTYDIRSHPRVGVLLDGLRQQGYTVDELNRPLGIGTAGRVDALKSARAALAFVMTLVARWGSLIWGSLRFRGKNSPDALLVGYLGHFDVVLARLLFPTHQLLLDHLIFAADTAADRRLDGGAKSVLLRLLDWTALCCASTIIVDTPDHRRLVPERFQSKAVVVPVGAPDSWFDARSVQDAPSTAERPSIVFFGLFTPLQGTPTIANALEALDRQGVACDVTLVGSGQDAEECREIIRTLSDNVAVTWHDWVSAEDLPFLVARHDICLGIFGTSAKSQHVVPNKAYQGMAAGCALVTSDTPSQRAMLHGASFVPSGDSEALAAELERLLTEPSDLESAKSACAERADEAFHPRTVIANLREFLK